MFTAPGTARTPGSGGLVFISRTVAEHCQFLGFHPDIPLAWVLVGDVVLGFVYVRHRYTEDAQSLADFMAALHADITAKMQLGRVVLLGDFNARLGDLQDAMHDERWCADGVHDDVGQLLMSLARESDLAALTGRMDDGEPSYTVLNSVTGVVSTSRIDHAFVSCSLLQDRINDFGVHTCTYGSDHYPLDLTFTAQLSAPAAPAAGPSLRWNHLKQLNYVQQLLALHNGQAAIMHAIDSGDIALADRLIHDAVWAAARAAGLVANPHHNPKPRLLPLSSDARACMLAIAVRRRNGLPISATLRQEARRHLKAAARLQAHVTTSVCALCCPVSHAFFGTCCK